jgi:hypothetical protein
LLAAEPRYGLGERIRFAVEHAGALLDQPGEWHRDSDSGRLVVWPRDGGGPLEASVAASLIVLRGAAHVRIEQLTLESVRGDAIAAENITNVDISNVVVRNTGGRAVVLETASKSSVRASRIQDTGDGGIVLSGGNRTLLLPARLHIEDSIIERYARLGLSNRPAITAHGVGSRIRGNVIDDGPNMAIEFTGNDHEIVLNEISRAARETGDAGAIYTGRDWTAQGTVVMHNFLHDIRGRPGLDVKGVYLDDLASGIRVEGNVFLRVDQPLFIGGGRDNRLTGNLMVASEPGVHIDGRGQTWMREAVVRADDTLQTRLRTWPIEAPLWRQRFPELYRTLTDEPQKPKRNLARGNLFLAGTAYRLLQEVDPGAQQLELEEASRRVSARIPDALLRRAVEADSATALGRMLARYLEPAGLDLLPFEEMDRRRRLPR